MAEPVEEGRPPGLPEGVETRRIDDVSEVTGDELESGLPLLELQSMTWNGQDGEGLAFFYGSLDESGNFTQVGTENMYWAELASGYDVTMSGLELTADPDGKVTGTIQMTMQASGTYPFSMSLLLEGTRDSSGVYEVAVLSGGQPSAITFTFGPPATTMVPPTGSRTHPRL